MSGAGHAGVTISDEDALTAMRLVRDGRSLELVAEHYGITRHVLSFWMRGKTRTYLLEQLEQEGKPCLWQYNDGRRVPSQLPDEVALDAMRRVRTGESINSVARNLGVKRVVVLHWLQGKTRSYLLARLNTEPHAEEPVQGELL